MDLVANIFSVLGAADVVVRSSASLYDLLKRTVDAPENRLQLLWTLEILSHIATEAQEYSKQYERSTYVRKNGMEPLRMLERILKDCHFHIKRLTDLVESCPITLTDSLIQNLKMRFKYTSKTAELIKSCKKLQEHMVSITVILNVNSA